MWSYQSRAMASLYISDMPIYEALQLQTDNTEVWRRNILFQKPFLKLSLGEPWIITMPTSPFRFITTSLWEPSLVFIFFRWLVYESWSVCWCGVWLLRNRLQWLLPRWIRNFLSWRYRGDVQWNRRVWKSELLQFHSRNQRFVDKFDVTYEALF